MARAASGLTAAQNSRNLEVPTAEAGTSYLRRTSKRAELAFSLREEGVELTLDEEEIEEDLVIGEAIISAWPDSRVRTGEGSNCLLALLAET